MRTPISRVSGLGSAKNGTHHWWMQRISAIALVVLGLAFICPLAQHLGASRADILIEYTQPFYALVAALFIAVGCWHFKLGFQVVVEDYVHHAGARTTLLILNTLGSAGLAFAGVFAVAKIAFGG